MKKIKKESGPDQIRKAKDKSGKVKKIEKLLADILWRFDIASNQGFRGGREICNVIDEISPWQNEISEEDPNLDGKFDRMFNAIKTSFGLGYVLGQMLDLPDIDTTPVKEFLREKKALLYMPYERKAV